MHIDTLHNQLSNLTIAKSTIDDLRPTYYDQLEQTIDFKSSPWWVKKLVKSLHPFCGFSAEVQEQQRAYHAYTRKQHPTYLSYKQARKIVEFIQKKTPEMPSSNTYECFARKDTKLDVKIFLKTQPQEITLLLYHKKTKQQPYNFSAGTDKIGRVALMCCITKYEALIKTVWHLKSRKQSETYYNSRERDFFLYQQYKYSSVIFPDKLFDYTCAKNQRIQRGCFYKQYKDLLPELPISDLNRAYKILTHAAEQFTTLHQDGYYILDIKPENLLLDEKDTVIICDLDSIVKDPQLSPVLGTYCYMAAELYQLDKSLINYEYSDVFSFGCLIFETIFPNLPWKRTVIELPNYVKDYTEQATKAQNCIMNTTLPKKELLEQLALWAFHPEPNQRPSMEQIYHYLLLYSKKK